MTEGQDSSSTNMDKTKGKDTRTRHKGMTQRQQTRTRHKDKTQGENTETKDCKRKQQKSMTQRQETSTRHKDKTPAKDTRTRELRWPHKLTLVKTTYFTSCTCIFRTCDNVIYSVEESETVCLQWVFPFPHAKQRDHVSNPPNHVTLHCVQCFLEHVQRIYITV